MSPILKHFAFGHLPARLQEVSRPICELAQQMDSLLSDGAEKSVGLRKLLEAKDAFVRAAIESHDARVPAMQDAEPVSSLPPHQQRVIDERDELNEKLLKLQDFISSSSVFENLADEEKSRLLSQCKAMVEYWSILDERISNFTASCKGDIFVSHV